MRLLEVLVQKLKLVVAKVAQPSTYVILDVAVVKLTVIRMLSEDTFRLGDDIVNYRAFDQSIADRLVKLGVPVLQVKGTNSEQDVIVAWCVAGNVTEGSDSAEDVSSKYVRELRGIVDNISYVEYNGLD